MSINFRARLSRILIVAGILWTFAFLATACGSIDAVFTILEASLAAIGPVLALVGTLLAPGEAAMITTAVTDLTNVIVVLKSSVDAYLADTTSITLFAKVEDALKVAQNAVPAFLAAVNITNPTIATWVTAVVSAVNGVFIAVASSIVAPAKAELNRIENVNYALPKDGPEKKESFNKDIAKALNQKASDIATTFVGQIDAATASSGLPYAAKQKFHGDFHRHVGPHVGPLHV
jgi:hypothetical protein